MFSTAIRVAKNEGEKFMGRAVEFLLGKGKERFFVHEKLIRASSPFFDKVMSATCLESMQHTGTIQLSEDEPEIFGIYVHWLYYNKLPVCCNEPGCAANQEYLKLVKAYTLGNKLMDTGFQNAAIDAIVEKSTSAASDGKRYYPVTEVVEYAYNNTHLLAPIRRLLVDMHVSVGSGKWLDYGNFNSERVPQRFLFELSSKLLDLRRGTRAEVKASDYHVHVAADMKMETEKTEMEIF
ncbi:uncharacterized protein BHQ10_001910 [Talaromyces amestolkiae]|uniref:BTB domain-containing protein n=1 Tax=Talaromyces amestolkiae TaxID=1196081 RepID=A0A364KQS1_TALAM|nr:uncharacterized protein BHQ10_001910 [Talaromyces amestolkiae]RAO65898.1 hypothetical protein BHQ10_001910 [Talaromyces amestolkiae]